MGRQEFIENGNLKPGIHKYSIIEFEKQFVNEFSESLTRTEIYNNFRQWLNLLIDIKPPRYLWLDGSFLTTKLNSNDLDLVLFYRPEDITNELEGKRILNLINNISRKFKCDAYFSYCFDHLDVYNQQSIPPEIRTKKTYWKGQFGFDRNDNAKGIILIDDNEISKLGGDF